MAIVSVPFSRLEGGGQVLFEILMEIDDTDWRETNDDGDPDDFRVLRFHGTNYHTKPLIVSVKRGSGAAWVDRTIPAGQAFSQDTGGPVKYEKDVPDWTWTWEQ